MADVQRAEEFGPHPCRRTRHHARGAPPQHHDFPAELARGSGEFEIDETTANDDLARQGLCGLRAGLLVLARRLAATLLRMLACLSSGRRHSALPGFHMALASGA